MPEQTDTELTRVTYKLPGDGDNKLFPILWPYIDRGFVVVKLQADPRDESYETLQANEDYTWVTDSQIEISPAPPANSTVIITRDTPSDRALVKFKDGSVLLGKDLNGVSEQMLHIIEEGRDYTDQVKDYVEGAEGYLEQLGGLSKALEDAENAADMAEQYLRDAKDIIDEAKAAALETIADSVTLPSGVSNSRRSWMNAENIASGTEVYTHAAYYPGRNTLLLTYNGVVCHPASSGVPEDIPQYMEMGPEDVLSDRVIILFDAPAGGVWSAWSIASNISAEFDAQLLRAEAVNEDTQALAESLSHIEDSVREYTTSYAEIATQAALDEKLAGFQDEVAGYVQATEEVAANAQETQEVIQELLSNAPTQSELDAASAAAGQASQAASQALASSGLAQQWAGNALAAQEATQELLSNAPSREELAEALTAAEQASQAGAQALTSAELAQQWAEAPVDEPVQNSDGGGAIGYSAYHWAVKAQENASAGISLSDRVDSDSPDVAASSLAVKRAYDVATNGIPKTGAAGTANYETMLDMSEAVTATIDYTSRNAWLVKLASTSARTYTITADAAAEGIKTQTIYMVGHGSADVALNFAAGPDTKIFWSGEEVNSVPERSFTVFEITLAGDSAFIRAVQGLELEPGIPTVRFHITFPTGSSRIAVIPRTNRQTLSSDAVIDWGDGTTTQYSELSTTANAALSHTYAAVGDYIVSLSATSGNFGRNGTSTVLNDIGAVCRAVEGTLPARTTVQYLFYGWEKLSTIGAKLFTASPEILAFTGCFRDCYALTSLPGGLFNNNAKVTSFGSCFSGCRALLSIPEGLFSNNTEARTFDGCFGDCYALGSVPVRLFGNNTKAADFNFCFSSCLSLTSIPEGLFDNNLAASEFGGCFQGCTSLTFVPYGLFDNNVTAQYFGRCFSGCAMIESPVPQLWLWPDIVSWDGCYYGCYAAPNYADIPDEWKDDA